jgi:hypothetical protein
MASGNSNFGNAAGTGTVGADGFLGPLTGNVTGNQSGGTVAAVGVLSGDATTGITAFAGGGQSSATALTTVVNEVVTVGTAADSVKLPAPSKVGQMVIVINAHASNAIQVFGSGTDTINGVATATGVSQAAGKTALYVAATTGTAAKWYRNLSA